MNGPEHYREAERLLAAARTGSNPNTSAEEHLAVQANMIAQAQAHATMALAAATAASQATAYDGDEDGSRTRGWSGVV